MLGSFFHHFHVSSIGNQDFSSSMPEEIFVFFRQELDKHWPESIGKTVMLFVQVDEFQELSNNDILNLSKDFGSLMMSLASKHEHGIQIFPVFTGTSASSAMDLILFSQFKARKIFLERISDEAAVQVLKLACEKDKREQVEEFFEEDIVQELIGYLGGVPRFLGYFIMASKNIDFHIPVGLYRCDIIYETILELVTRQYFDSMEKSLSDRGMLNLLYFAITKKKVWDFLISNIYLSIYLFIYLFIRFQAKRS